MKSLAYLYTRIIDCPLAIHPTKFDAILGAIGGRLGLEATDEQIEAAAKSSKSQNKNYTVQDGIAIIPISGSLMKKTSGLMAMSGSSSYESIGAEYQDAMKNPAIKGILLDVDSPGGETSGLFELAELMSESRSSDKPVYAIADDAAFSAAYALASVADKIYLTCTAGVGSVGVFCCHIDQSQSDTKQGMKYTFIHAGDKKVDGNSHQPLSNSAQNDTQNEVNRQYEMFVSLVAANRGVSEDEIANTEAGCYFGENAIPLLADKMGTAQDAFNDLKAQIDKKESINTNVKKKTSLNTKAGKLAEENMAKKELSIDELVVKHAAAIEAETETPDEDTPVLTARAETETCDEESSKAKGKAKAAPDNDDDDDEDEDDDDEDDKKNDSKKGTRADAVRIVNLCTLANLPLLASEFLGAEYTVAEVEAALLKYRAGKTKSVKIQSSTKTNSGNEFRSKAAELFKDKTVKDKAQAFREYLLEQPEQYVQSMLHRENGQNYTFLQKRGF